jgi:hypothetical protein
MVRYENKILQCLSVFIVIPYQDHNREYLKLWLNEDLR